MAIPRICFKRLPETQHNSSVWFGNARQYLTYLLIVTTVLFTGWTAMAQNSEKENIFAAVVGVRANIPPDARTATILGTERLGSGVVIDSNGLILTIGYLILEAHNTTVIGPNKEESAAEIVAYDHDSGFGLIRATNPLKVSPLRLGNSSQVEEQDNVLVVASGGRQPIIGAQVASIREFTGGWEYLLENAIFTSPPHSFHSGAALLSQDGKLIGIGSLIVNETIPNSGIPGNMFVPVDILKPVLADLLQRGRRSGPVRPWIGANTTEVANRLIVSRVSKGGPADKAGLAPGDFILGVNDSSVEGQADFYRKLWETGEAGTSVSLNVLSAGSEKLEISKIEIKTADRYHWLQLNRTY
jgi:S1-C subfamily serine protease